MGKKFDDMSVEEVLRMVMNRVKEYRRLFDAKCNEFKDADVDKLREETLPLGILADQQEQMVKALAEKFDAAFPSIEAPSHVIQPGLLDAKKDGGGKTEAGDALLPPRKKSKATKKTADGGAQE